MQSDAGRRTERIKGEQRETTLHVFSNEILIECPKNFEFESF